MSIKHVANQCDKTVIYPVDCWAVIDIVYGRVFSEGMNESQMMTCVFHLLLTGAVGVSFTLVISTTKQGVKATLLPAGRTRTQCLVDQRTAALATNTEASNHVVSNLAAYL